MLERRRAALGFGFASAFGLAVLMSAPSDAARPSPPSAPPSPAEVDARVESILARMTLEQKIDYIGGVDGFFVRDMPELGLPRLKMADGPMGVRNFGPATAMAGGIALAASWNSALAERVGLEIGRDARAKGVHFLLGPGVNVYRAPMNGRNFEYFGEDPFLASQIAVSYIRGVQSQGVSATVKHFLANNSEFDRHNTDSVIDERALREIYLPAFEAAVEEAHVGAIMNSYNRTNGVHMSQNGAFNTDVVRGDWGFGGIMMSDWGGTYDGIAAANGGLDLEMPSGRFMSRETLLPAIEQGKVQAATIDEKVRRILRTAIRFGWLDREQTDLAIPRYNPQGREVALEAAREGMVLLKNERSLLPLERGKVRRIALVGPGAYPAAPVGGGSARVEPFAAVSFLQGVSDAAGSFASVTYNPGVPTLSDLARATRFTTAPSGGEPGLRVETFDNAELSGTPATTRTERAVNAPGGFGGGGFGQGPQPSSTRWTGYYTPEQPGAHDVFVQGAGERIRHRLFVDDELVLDSWSFWPALVAQATLDLGAGPHKVVLEQSRARSFGAPRMRLGIARQGTFVDPAARTLAAQADVVVVLAGFDHESESEGADRSFRLPPGQDELIREMHSANENTVVVITAGGNVDSSAWIDRVPALVQAWYAGQEAGRALGEILLGDVNPSGRLPVTFERRFEDNPVHDSYYPAEAQGTRVAYREGVFVGYRGYERSGTRPLFPFGHGLSYTTFGYERLALMPDATRDGNVSVSFDLTNTGGRAGAEVAQVYVAEVAPKVARPPKELRGFAKVMLKPGETRRVTVALGPRAFSYYDEKAGAWRADAGEFEVLVGRSSADTPLRARVRLESPLTTKR